MPCMVIAAEQIVNLFAGGGVHNLTNTYEPRRHTGR